MASNIDDITARISSLELAVGPIVAESTTKFDRVLGLRKAEIKRDIDVESKRAKDALL